MPSKGIEADVVFITNAKNEEGIKHLFSLKQPLDI